MARPVTLFTGQWADLTLEQLAAKVGEWEFDGLELACWGDHFDVARGAVGLVVHAPAGARSSSATGSTAGRSATTSWARRCAIRSTRVMQGVLPPEVWGDGDPEGVRRRAAERMKDTARAAAQLGVEVVTGFTGSSVWHMLYSFPPNDFAEIERGYEDFAERWNPIIDVFDAEGVRFALEVHPTEIAYDFVTTRKTLAAIDHREGFGINFDPSHFEHQFLDSAAFVTEFADRIYHVHVKDSIRHLDGRSSILGGHLNFGEAGRGWDFVSPGHGDVDFEALFRALNRIGYQGPLSVEWEDSGMDRDWGAPDALAFVRRDGLRAVDGGVRRGVREGGLVSKVGFVTMGESAGGEDIPTIGVGMLGYGFMGKAHSNAYKTLAYMTWPPPLMPQLVSIAGRNEEAVAGAARRYGFTDSRDRLEASSITDAADRRLRQLRARTTSTPSRRSPPPRRAST